MEFEGISVSVVRKPVKNIRLSVLSDCTLKVVAPEGYDVQSLLLEKKEWIIGHVKKKRDNACRYEEKSSKFLIFGNFFSVTPGDFCRIDYETMTIFYPSVCELRKFIKKRLKNDLDIRLCEIAGEMGVSYKGFSIRNQKSRWASCSTRGTLSFNIRISALAPHLRDYIIIHELAHIKEHNHSKNFWNIVENFCPDYRTYKKDLGEYWHLIEHNVFWKTILE